jgi:hypothetical protein
VDEDNSAVDMGCSQGRNDGHGSTVDGDGSVLDGDCSVFDGDSFAGEREVQLHGREIAQLCMTKIVQTFAWVAHWDEDSSAVDANCPAVEGL